MSVPDLLSHRFSQVRQRGFTPHPSRDDCTNCSRGHRKLARDRFPAGRCRPKRAATDESSLGKMPEATFKSQWGVKIVVGSTETTRQLFGALGVSGCAAVAF